MPDHRGLPHSPDSPQRLPSATALAAGLLASADGDRRLVLLLLRQTVALLETTEPPEDS